MAHSTFFRLRIQMALRASVRPCNVRRVKAGKRPEEQLTRDSWKNETASKDMEAKIKGLSKCLKINKCPMDYTQQHNMQQQFNTPIAELYATRLVTDNQFLYMQQNTPHDMP